MEKYIGLDVHATSCTAAVVNAQGKRLGSHVIETNGAALVAFFKTQAGTVRVFATLSSVNVQDTVRVQWMLSSDISNATTILGLCT